MNVISFSKNKKSSTVITTGGTSGGGSSSSNINIETIANNLDGHLSAAKLAETHKIWGNEFNGTQDVTGSIEMASDALIKYENGAFHFTKPIYSDGNITAFGLTSSDSITVMNFKDLNDVKALNFDSSDNGKTVVWNGTTWVKGTAGGSSGGGGQTNVQSDWNVTDTTSDAYILNKPTIPSTTTQISEGTNLYYTDARAQNALTGHTSDTTKHITAAERTAWNGKWTWNENDIKGVKVTNASSADKLSSTVKLWGNEFNGTQDVNGSIEMGTNALIKFENGAFHFTAPIYSDSYISAFGKHDDETPIVTYFKDLVDVKALSFGSSDNGKTIVWNGTAWVKGTAGGGGQSNVQSDWNVTDTTSDAYILNKPTSMPASDVYSWAKASSKPSYTTTEVTEGTNKYFTDTRAQNALTGHTSDTTKHVTAKEKSTWNGKWNYDEETIQGVKVDNASNADRADVADALSTSCYIWGNGFDGTEDINGSLFLGEDNSIYFGSDDSAKYIKFENGAFHFTAPIYSDGNITAFGMDNDETKLVMYFKDLSDVKALSFGSSDNGKTIVWDGTKWVKGTAGGGGQSNVQSDWNVTDTTSDAYILNKPTSMPASDVYSWAKASSKPSYTTTEVTEGTNKYFTDSRAQNALTGHTTDTTKHITAAERTAWNGKQSAITSSNKLSASLISGLASVATSGKYSDLTGTPSSLPASDVYSWAKASTKPSYTTTEVTEGTNKYFTDARAQAALTGHTSDTTKHITAAERTAWNAKWDYNENTIKAVKVTNSTYSDSASTAAKLSRVSWIPTSNTIEMPSTDMIMYFYAGQPVLTSTATDYKGYIGSSSNPKVISNPSGGTYDNGTQINSMGIRLMWNKDYYRDIFCSPNNDKWYVRGVVDANGKDWYELMKKKLDGTVEGYHDFTGNIIIEGTQSKLPSHFYHKLYDSSGIRNIYIHGYPSSDDMTDNGYTSRFNWRAALNGNFNALQWGDSWNGKSVLNLGDRSNGVLKIGNAVLSYDSTYNALKVEHQDGSAMNVYATGGMSALGFNGSSSNANIENIKVTDSIETKNIQVNTKITVGGSNGGTITGTSSQYGNSLKLSAAGITLDASSVAITYALNVGQALKVGSAGTSISDVKITTPSGKSGMWLCFTANSKKYGVQLTELTSY